MKAQVKAKIDINQIFLKRMKSEHDHYISLAEKYPSGDSNKVHYLSLAGRILREITHLEVEIKKLESEYDSIVDFKPMSSLKAISAAEYRSQE